MVFSSSVFLFHFLPVVFMAGFFVKKEYANYFLILGSLIFYAWGEPAFVLIMLGSIVINWLMGIVIEKK